jgi:chemotaxis protein MotA
MAEKAETKKEDHHPVYGHSSSGFDFTSLLGIISGFFLIGYAIFHEGGTLKTYFNASAAMLVIGGTMAAVYISFPAHRVHNVLFVFINIFRSKIRAPDEIVESVVQLAMTVRKGGTLKLEKEEKKIGDQFLKRCVEMVVDGVDPLVMEQVMHSEINSMKQRHLEGQHIFSTLASYAPAFGLIGTVVGLVQMMLNLNDPDKVGPSMAIAMIGTFYGIIFANMVFVPITEKLKARMNEEVFLMRLTAEGIMAMRNKMHPRDIELLLNASLPSSMRRTAQRAAEGGAATAGGKAA